MDIATQDHSVIPRCVGIIMDGNRRYAKAQGLFHAEGHLAGYQKLKRVVRWAKECGIKHVIAYTLSAENLEERDKGEIAYIMSLLRRAINEEVLELHKENVRSCFIGDFTRLPVDIQNEIHDLNATPMPDAEMTLCIAIAYGGRAEILHAAKKETADRIYASSRNIATQDVQETFGRHLWTAELGIPDPDMIIRTGGDMRLSGFLPWQSVYSELFFTRTFWPAFRKPQFRKMVLKDFPRRKRNFGK